MQCRMGRRSHLAPPLPTADKGIRYVGEAADVTGYEKGAAALLFINFALSLASGYFTLQAVTEIKQKQVGGCEWRGKFRCC